MRYISIALLLFLLCPVTGSAQFSFFIIKTPGDSLRESGALRQAVAAYERGMASGYLGFDDDSLSSVRQYYVNGTGTRPAAHYTSDVYNLAITFSRLGQVDSALYYMEKFVRETPDSSNEALSDPELINLHQSAGWSRLEDVILKHYCAKAKVRLKDVGYAKALWRMRALDQAYYTDIALAEKRDGKATSVVMAIWDLKRRIGQENQRELERLMKAKGWPKMSEVGGSAAGAAFLVIQHSTLAKQQQYLPVIERLCRAGEARWQDYALMYDRIHVATEGKQRYGSQVVYNERTQLYELSPLEDAARVDAWRKEAGLGPLSAYLKNWNIVWPASR